MLEINNGVERIYLYALEKIISIRLEKIDDLWRICIQYDIDGFYKFLSFESEKAALEQLDKILKAKEEASKKLSMKEEKELIQAAQDKPIYITTHDDMRLFIKAFDSALPEEHRDAFKEMVKSTKIGWPF